MEEEQLPPVAGSKEKRPGLLTLLCILTFIGSGLNALSNLMFFVFYDASMKFASEMVKTFKISGYGTVPECEAFVLCCNCPDQCSGCSRSSMDVATQETGLSYCIPSHRYW